MRIGIPELLVVLLIVVIILGPTQIPKLGRLLGKGVKGFREGLDTEESEQTNDVTEQAGGDR